MSRRLPRELPVLVTELDDGGMGKGMVDDRIVRVRNGLPGELVRARMLKRRSGEWFGEAVEVNSPAGQRVQPPCSAFPRCGGCSLQHLEYAAQLEHKQRGLLRALAAVQVRAKRVREPVSSVRLGYRRKARLGVRALGDELLVGFRESFSSRVARLQSCETLAHGASRLIKPLRGVLQGLDARRRIPQVEVVVGDADVGLMIRHLDPLSGDDRAALAAFAHSHDVQIYLQPGGYDSLELLAPAHARQMDYALPAFGVTLQFGLADFVQANAPLNELLVSAAVNAVAPASRVRVLDLFCGIGNFSLPLARRGANVLGFDASSAVQRASRNAEHNGLGQRCEFRSADLYDHASGVVGDAHVLLLDPPRTGAGNNLAQWLQAPSLQRVVYVSCNPVTFAKDAQTLARQDFQLTEVGIYDMFPQTAHVETLGVFARSGHG